MPDPQQDLQPGTYRIRNVLTGTILDPNDGTLVIGSTYSTGSNQTWNLEAGSNGYRFRNEASDTYLGYILKQDWVLRGLRNPVEWTVTKAGDGYSIRPAQMPKLVIDLANGNRGNNAKICLWSYHGGNNQLWRFESV
ncbi:carbohydrate-binding module family 13 protein [Tulasnella calospora MUT 4182]|uniref:Carbohydrate-binding module family 13 protein n=1 Tax=Tulasnella calospora MUT 4182 TaxID=1051891 RepID=A0A0C3L348_9AGAM|nr:carbohydrate-binding module family 13 protein [Tulasnella calospora MUT 4182]